MSVVRWGSFACVAFICACGRAEAPSRGRPSPGTPTVVLIRAGLGCISGQGDLTEWVAPAVCAAQKRLQELGLTNTQYVEAERDAVLETLAVERKEPLIVLFAGHGALVHPTRPGVPPLQDPRWVTRCPEVETRCVSVACAGVPVTLDEMVQAVPPGVPWAFFMVDACTSAHVDVRLARARVSVASVSPFPVDGDRSLLTEGIASLGDQLDRDCDGVTTDLEFFLALNSTMAQGGKRGAFLADPKLRRNSAWLFPVLTAPPRADCRPRSAEVAKVDPLSPACQETQKVGPDTYMTYAPLPAKSPLMWNGRTIPASSLQVTPCEAELGQCFREYP